MTIHKWNEIQRNMISLGFRTIESIGETIMSETFKSCLVEAFFREEQKKPAHLRNNGCMISCPCAHCNQAIM